MEATNKETSEIRVAIVEDDRAVREGLGMIINATPGYRCVGTFFSVEDALRRMNGAGPDVMLLDIHLPGILGSEGVRLFLEKYPTLHVLMLTVYAEQDKVFESICNGACGYLLKKTPPAKLLEAIREAHEGGAPMSPTSTGSGAASGCSHVSSGVGSGSGSITSAAGQATPSRGCSPDAPRAGSKGTPKSGGTVPSVVAKRLAMASASVSGWQLWQRPAASFQQLVQVYWRQSMQKLKDSWNASSCLAASPSAWERMASPSASDNESWLRM